MRIFQRGFNYSQDGPGNRLVYHLQGCNLRCPWCSNPDGLSQTGGSEYSVSQLFADVERSRMMFFDGGGVTFTGGEATMQFAELRELLLLLHRAGISTCIETNGLSPRLPELFCDLDLIIMDVKHYDPETHRRITGRSNIQTIKNVTAALSCGRPLALRIPLIGGFNASENDAIGFRELFTELGVPGRATVELLPYHEYGKSKYAALHIPYRMGPEAKVSLQQVNAFGDILRGAGIEIIHT